MQPSRKQDAKTSAADRCCCRCQRREKSKHPSLCRLRFPSDTVNGIVPAADATAASEGADSAACHVKRGGMRR